MENNIQIRVKELVSQDKIDEAIELLFSRFNPYLSSRKISTVVKKNYNGLVRISSRLRRLEKESREGILDHDEVSRQRSKILLSFIDYVDDLPTSVVRLLEQSSEEDIAESIKNFPEVESEQSDHRSEQTISDDSSTSQVETVSNAVEIAGDEKSNRIERNSGKSRTKVYLLLFSILAVACLVLFGSKFYLERQEARITEESVQSDVEELLKYYLFEDAFSLVDSVRAITHDADLNDTFFNGLITQIKEVQKSVDGRVGYLPIGDKLESNPTFLKNSNVKGIDFEMIESLSDIALAKLYMTSVNLPLYARIDTQRMINNANIIKFIPPNSSFRALTAPISVKHRDATRPIFWLYVELVTPANPIFEQELINIDTLADSIRTEYLEDSTLLFKVEYFPQLPKDVSSSRDTSGAYLYPFIITENSNRYFVSVAAYNSFYYALMQRKNLLNFGYSECKIVLYNNKYVVSLADFSSSEEVEAFKKEEKENFGTLYAFRNNK